MEFLHDVLRALIYARLFFKVLLLAAVLAYLFYQFVYLRYRQKIDCFFENDRNAKTILLVLFGTGFIIYSLNQLNLYYTLASPMRDVGIFDQAVWNLAHFHLPASSLRNIPNLWGDHFNPILIFIVPFYWLKNDVRWLYLIQAFVVSLGVFPVFGIAREKLKSNFTALCFAFSYLFFLGIQYAVAFGFYPETLAVTFLLFALYFFFKNRPWPFFLFLILALLCKENISLYVLFLGLWVLIFTRKRIVGLISIVLGIVWYKLTVSYLIPHLAEQAGYIYFRYQQFGSSPYEVVKTIFSRPWFTFKTLFSPSLKVESWLKYFVPFAFLPFFSSFFLVLLPLLLEKFLASEPFYWVMGYHYGANAAPFLIVGAILSTASILKCKIINRFKNPSSVKAVFVGVFLVFISIIISWKLDSPLFGFLKSGKLSLSLPPNYQEAVKFIPKNSSVTAQMTLGTPIEERSEMYWWSDYPEQKKGDYILLSCNPDYNPFPYTPETNIEKIKEILKDTNYGVRYSQGDILLLEKGFSPSSSLSTEMENCLK